MNEGLGVALYQIYNEADEERNNYLNFSLQTPVTANEN